jgi:hypothetical protein
VLIGSRSAVKVESSAVGTSSSAAGCARALGGLQQDRDVRLDPVRIGAGIGRRGAQCGCLAGESGFERGDTYAHLMGVRGAIDAEFDPQALRRTSARMPAVALRTAG